MKFDAALLLSAFVVIAIGCSSDQQPVATIESPTADAEEASVDDLIDTLISDDAEDSGGGQSAPAKPTTTPSMTPEAAAEIPQRFIDAPARNVVMKHANGKPHKAFQAKQLGPKSVIQHGRYEEYFATGKKLKAGSYDYGRKTGEWKFWDQSGKLRKQGAYQKDTQEGDWKKFRTDGSLEWIEKYKDGQPHGTWEAFREDGKTLTWRRGYQNGKRSGPWEGFYPDGKPKALETFRDGELHGEAKTWNEAGKLTGEGSYQNGKPHGLFRVFDKTGAKLVEETMWEEGVRKRKG